MSKTYTFEECRSIFEEAIRKYEGDEFYAEILRTHKRPVFPAAPRNCAIIGIRHEGKETKFRENAADDTIVLVRIDGDGKRQVYQYAGTTESGFFEEVINKEGDFKMSPGFSYFSLGRHHGEHDCLVQACDVIGERAKKGKAYDETDNKRWRVPSTIHIHAGVTNPKGNVGNWSAGCTVIAGGWGGRPWKEFYDFCKRATNMPIPYVLVNEADVPALLEAAQASAAVGSNGSNGAHSAAQPVTVGGAGVAVATVPDEVRAASAPPAVFTPTQTVTPSAAASTTSAAAPTTPAAAAPQAAPVQASTGSKKRTTATIAGVVVALVASIKGFMEADPVASALIIIGVVAAVVWLLSWYIHAQKDLDKKRMELAADPSKNVVR